MNPIPQRYMRRISIDPSGCWLWTGTKGGGGYGRVSIDGNVRPAHRIIYEIAVGPVSKDLVSDHLCRNRLCVNPTHLEFVTNKVNVLRGIGRTAVNAVKTHCRNGHEFTPGNTHIRVDGSRLCRTCSRESHKKRLLNNPDYRERKNAKLRVKK